MTKCYRSGLFFPIVFVLVAQFIAGADDHTPAIAWRIPIGQPPANPGGRKPELTGMIDEGFWQGAPVGGFGAGTFSRSYRGNFERWHIKAGVHKYQNVPANQFAVFAQADGEQPVAQVLSTGKPEGSALSTWNWSYRAASGEYAALYPKSWFAYRSSELPVTLTLEQFSPVLPDNYKETSYPVALYNWYAENPSSKPVTVSIPFSWTNMVGWFRDVSNNFNGALSHQDKNEYRSETVSGGSMPGTMHGIESRQEPRTALRLRIREIAQVRVRYGYRKIRVLLNREGWKVGKKLVYRNGRSKSEPAPHDMHASRSPGRCRANSSPSGGAARAPQLF